MVSHASCKNRQSEIKKFNFPYVWGRTTADYSTHTTNTKSLPPVRMVVFLRCIMMCADVLIHIVCVLPFSTHSTTTEFIEQVFLLKPSYNGPLQYPICQPDVLYHILWPWLIWLVLTLPTTMIINKIHHTNNYRKLSFTSVHTRYSAEFSPWTPEQTMNERRAQEREQQGQMTSPEQRRQQTAARCSLNTIPQPQFQAPPNPPQGDGQQEAPPLYRGGVCYPGLHPGFIPHGVPQPLPMHMYPNLPWHSVANHQRNVGNYQPLAAAYGAQNWNEFNQRFQQERQARQMQQFGPGGHGQLPNQNH